MTAPDFFLVGAPKAATSSLHSLLIQHPGVFMCRPKEPHFFSTDLPGLAEVAHRAAYDALFAETPDGVKCGEASAFYLSSREAAKNIHAANPQARIILSIRNPTDAALSLYHQLRDGFREDQTNFAEAWALQGARARGEQLPSYCPEPAQLQYCDIYSYYDQITRYFEVFGRDAVKVLRFEDIVAEPARIVEEVLSFIGVPPFETPVALPHKNSRRQSRFPILTQMITAPPRPLKPLVGPLKKGLNAMGIKPSVVMMKHLSRPAEKQDSVLDSELRRELVGAFAPDVDRLETLLGQDLSAWRA